MLRKRTWLAVLAAVGALLLAMAGCGSDDESGGSSSGSNTAASSGSDADTAGAGTIDVGTGEITPKDTKRIAFFGQATPAYTYTVAQVNAAKAAGKAAGYDVDIYHSNLDPATELQNFNASMTGDKYSGVIFQPVNSQLCTPVQNQSVQQNIIVGVVGNSLCNDGTGVGDELWSPGTAFYVGGANAVDGVKAVLDAAAAANPGPQDVAFVMGIKGHPSVNAWEAAWKDFSPDHPDMKLVTTVYTDFTTPGAFKATQDLLQGNPGINMIFTLYIDVGVGIAKALDDAGQTGKIKLYENGGGSKIAKQLVEQGKIAGDLPVYPADNGRVGVEQMIMALEGKQPPKYTGGDGNPEFTATGLITKDNVAEFTPQW